MELINQLKFDIIQFIVIVSMKEVMKKIEYAVEKCFTKLSVSIRMEKIIRIRKSNDELDQFIRDKKINGINSFKDFIKFYKKEKNSSSVNFLLFKDDCDFKKLLFDRYLHEIKNYEMKKRKVKLNRIYTGQTFVFKFMLTV